MKALARPASWLLLLCAMCAVAPLLFIYRGDADRDTRVSSAMWPETWRGRKLAPLELTTREQVFLSGFPGAVRRFSDGERELVMRWVTSATRRLHPAADCYRALGFKIDDTAIVRNQQGTAQHCFTARRNGEAWRVCEQISETDGNATWTDVSAWYWSALLNSSHGPWWVVTTAERTASN